MFSVFGRSLFATVLLALASLTACPPATAQASGEVPGSGQTAAATTPAANSQLVPAKLLSSREPEYSDSARRKKISGTVRLRLTVGTDGRPHDITVLRSLEPSLDAKAVESVGKYIFAPATRDGTPVPQTIFIDVVFAIH